MRHFGCHVQGILVVELLLKVVLPGFQVFWDFQRKILKSLAAAIHCNLSCKFFKTEGIRWWSFNKCRIKSTFSFPGVMKSRGPNRKILFIHFSIQSQVEDAAAGHAFRKRTLALTQSFPVSPNLTKEIVSLWS